MADEKKHIDDLLRDGLGNYAETPPYNAWADMEARLQGGTTDLDDLLREAFAGKEVVPPVGAWADMEARLTEKPRRRRGLIWFWLAASVAGVLLGGLWIQNKDNKATTARQEQPSHEVPVSNTINKQQVGTSETGNLPAQSVTNEKQEESLVQQTPATAVSTGTSKPKPSRSETSVSPKPENIASVPVQNKQVDQVVQKPDSPAKDKLAAQQKSNTTQQSSTATSDSAKSDGPVDDIATAISKRGSGVVMNITKSPYADSMAKVEEQLKQKALAIASARPAKIAKRMLPKPVAVPDVPIATTSSATPKTVDTVNGIAAGAIGKTANNLQGINDGTAPGAKQIPDVTFIAPTDDVKQLAAQDPDSDKGSLAAFIGPLPDTTNYLADVQNMDPVTAEATIRERLFFDVFAKAGFERGFYKQTANKFAFGLSLQAHLSDKFSLIFQPTFKTGQVNYSQVSGARSYYQVQSSYMDSVKIYTTGINSAGIIFDTVKANYYYQQTHDSLVLSHSFENRTISEVDLPVMASYNVGRGWSLYGGPVLNYSTILKVKESRQVYRGETRRDTITFPATLTSQSQAPPGINEIFTYNVENVSKYNASQYSNSTVNKLRLGYMLGASWMYKDKLSLDVSVQQNLSRMDYVPNAGIRNIYLQPYMRFMIGYKLAGKKR